MHEALYERARQLGIQHCYIDAVGKAQTVDPAVLSDLVTVMAKGTDPADGHIDVRSDAPIRQAYQPPFAIGGQKCWLLTVQLYCLRSEHNWGHGDFGDLSRLLEIVATAGGDGIGLNPLHLLFEDRPDDPSPYAPSSRLFLNPLYLDMTSIPGLSDADRAEFRPPPAESDDTPIDYTAVSTAKYTALRRAHRTFRDASSPDLIAFDTYKRDAGPVLRKLGLFSVLRQRHGPHPSDWPTADDTENTDQDNEEIDFQAFVQWQAHEQLSACTALAQRLGLRVGLYLDLAVGVHPDGFDAWNDRRVFLKDLTIGAPPDPLNQAGQNWGLTAFSPHALHHDTYRAFRRTLAATMRYAGAIRFDHILGLNRLYAIPHGRTGRDGAYITQPLENLLDALADESRANECLVIGEDLGTVPDGFRELLRDFGIWTFLVTIFMRDENGAFQKPSDYPAHGLATFATHDLPTLAGWLEARDLTVLRALGIPAGETARERRRSQTALATALDQAGVTEGNMFERVSAFLAQTPSQVLSITLEDVLGLTDQVNLPGTYREYPNWRQACRIDFEVLNTKLTALGRLMERENRSRPR